MILGVIVALWAAGFSCGYNESGNRDRLTLELLSSIRADTEFHRTLVLESSKLDVAHARGLVPSRPKIMRRDFSMFVSPTYFIELDRGAIAVLEFGGASPCVWDVVPWSARWYPCVPSVAFVLRDGELQ